MSVEVERRLRDLFEAIDVQVDLPEPAPATRRRRWPTVLAAAVIVAVAVGIAVDLSDRTGRGDVDEQVPAVSIVPAARFDEDAGLMCAVLDRARNGVEPRFRTAEAYRVVIGSRRLALAEASAALEAAGVPDDDPTLPGRVLARFERARFSIDRAEAALDAGDLADAAAWWSDADPITDQALAELGRHGAEPCQRQEPS